MASMREIKGRIASVTSTGQIIRALDSIASSKLHKARAQLEGAKPMAEGLGQLVDQLCQFDGATEHPYLEKRPVKNSLYLVLSSNQGYAGGYNANVLNTALRHMEARRKALKQTGKVQESIIVGGKKGESFFRQHKKNIIQTVNDIADSQVYFYAEKQASWLAKQFLEGHYDEIYLVYTHFQNVLSYEPKVRKLLPLEAALAKEADPFTILSPSLDDLLEHTVPLHLHMQLFYAFSDSHTSEQAARMVAMNTAGKNAEELIEKLGIQYNKERQAAITQELNEIIGGSKSKKQRM